MLRELTNTDIHLSTNSPILSRSSSRSDKESLIRAINFSNVTYMNCDKAAPDFFWFDCDVHSMKSKPRYQDVLHFVGARGVTYENM